MMEIETKIDGIDRAETEGLLARKDARFMGRKLMKRWIFVLQREKGADRFLRLRTDGTAATLAYKYRSGEGLANTEELETPIGNFGEAAKIFSRLVGESYYQENYRSTYSYGDAEITIDEWPKIPPVMEIEAKSEQEVRRVIGEFGIRGRELGNISWEKVYAIHGLDLSSFKVLKFEPRAVE